MIEVSQDRQRLGLLDKAKQTLMKLDRFQTSVPQVNHQGARTKSSWFGLVATLMIFVTMVLYGQLKFDILVNRKNAQITTNETV